MWRHADGVDITTPSGTQTFDATVVATHPDQALRLLTDATAHEKEVLGEFTYSKNAVVLHSDDSLVPVSQRALSAWNYRTSACGGAGEAVMVTYDMNRLQHLEGGRFLVTLNDSGAVDPMSVYARMNYEHPVFTPQSVAAQRLLPTLNSPQIAFAGAYHGWGFHEDGAASGLAAAQALGGTWLENTA